MDNNKIITDGLRTLLLAGVGAAALTVDKSQEILKDLESWLREKRGGAADLLVPRRGEKRALVLMAEKNARDALEKQNAQPEKLSIRDRAKMFEQKAPEEKPKEELKAKPSESIKERAKMFGPVA